MKEIEMERLGMHIMIFVFASAYFSVAKEAILGRLLARDSLDIRAPNIKLDGQALSTR
jgi:hypothetical protein